MADTTPDYSNSPLTPTPVTSTADGTGFRTTLSNAVGGSDTKDYVTFTVPAGQRLTSFELSSYSSSDGVAFIALQPGSSVTGTESNTTPFSGYAHFGSSSSVKVGTNLIAVLGGPLQAGSYSAWIQQLGASTDYSFTLKTVQLTPTYGLTATATSVNEGANAVFTLTTTNVSAGTVLTYTLSGVSESDIVGGLLTGTVTIGANGQGTITVGIAADLQTDYTDTLKVTVETASATMTIADTSKGVYLNGTSANDKLVGEISNDSLYGNAGNDTLDGGAGSDYLDGGSGNDTVDGGVGNDSITGSEGNDLIYAGDGNDNVAYTSDVGDDTVYGGNGDDNINYNLLAGRKLLYGEAGNDTLYGGNENDTLLGGIGTDKLTGGNGADSLDGGDNDDSLYGNAGNDTLDGGAGSDYLDGGSGNDTVDGGVGNDSITGSEGNDLIYAGDGNDQINYVDDSGDDTVYGGSGNDLVNYSDLSGKKTILGESGNDTLYGGVDADSINGGTDNDTIYGNAGSDTLDGAAGDDYLSGGDGNDTLDGGAGSDSLYGGEGDDTYLIDSLSDYVYDSGGNDQAIVSVSWAKIPSSIEKITYSNGANALPYWVGALIYDKASGNTFEKLLGDGNTFYYVFPTTLPTYDKKAEHGVGYTAFNAIQKANTQTALSYISTVLDIKFAPSNTADQPNTFAFALNNQIGSAGYAQSPDDEPTGSDVFLNNKDYNATLNPGTDGAQTLIHEIGHALGLKHPFDEKDADGDVATPPYLQGDEDNTRWTQMSYTQRDQDNVLSYSPLDIAALQYLYGPSKTVRTGNDTYALKTTEANFIWDGVGNDTISAVGANQPVTLYLEPGYWSYFGAAKAATITSAGQITVNFGSVIENAIGTSAADSIFGNSVANSIEGGAGADSLSGLGGFDTLVGDAGDDILDGGGDFDVASYAKAASAYKLSLGTNKISLADPSGSEGTDTLINIECLKFTDKTIRIDTKAHGSYADLPDTLYQFFVVGFGAAPGVTYMDQMAEAYRYWLPQYKDGTVKQIVEAFTTKSQFTSVYPQALYRTEGGKYYAYAHDASLAGNPLVRGAEVSKAVFDTQMASLAQGLVATIVKTSASEATKKAATADIQAALGLGGDWTIGKVIYTVFGNLASKPLSDPTWGGTAKQFANQVAVAKYYTDTLSQSTDDVTTLRSVMAAVTNTTDVSSTDAIASLIGVALLNGPGG